MKIKSISIKNYLGISELNRDLGKINLIKGDSGKNKTSFVEAIEKLFTNTNRRTEVVKHGEEEAILFAELDDGMSVERRVRTEKSDYLKVKHDSKGVQSTEGFLRKFINGDIFRPIEFVNKPYDEQAKIILNMLEIPWDIENIKAWFGEVPEADYKNHILQILKEIENKYYKERESVNREISLLKANIEGIKKDLPANYDGTQWKALDLQELYKAVTDAEENNKKLDIAEGFINRLKEQLQSIEQTAGNEKESKKLLYQRQRDSLKKSIEDLETMTKTEQAFVDDADRRISEESIRLDNELEREIERLKAQYVTKKQLAKDNIMREVEQSKITIQEYQTSKATKETQLTNIDALEKKDIELIEQDKLSKIETEKIKSNNAHKIIETVTRIEVEPLREKANEAARMKEFLREWERMNDIIRDKLSPKEQRSTELTTKIQKARELPQELLKTAALPVEGLEIDDKGRIRINGTLLDGLSDGEKVDFAFRLAKAQAGELKVICIDGWQNLGSKARQILEEAMTDDFQYFLLETVEDTPFEIETLE
jgi:exonuclease SbcC